MPPFIEFQDVSVNYGKYVKALRKVSFKVEKGEFVFLVGRTGSGKSTLLKLLSRQSLGTEGTTRFDGVDVSTIQDRDIPTFRRRFGIVPQDFGLLPRKKAFENIGYAMRAVGRTQREVRKLVPGILERVNLAHRVDAYPEELSGGEQQRLAIARALINDPEVILADEPTGNLDPEHSVEIMEVLMDLNRKGVTILIATHDFPIIEKYPGRIIKLDKGLLMSDEVKTC
jgi:cell division transport system ATP-binding protein